MTNFKSNGQRKFRRRMLPKIRKRFSSEDERREQIRLLGKQGTAYKLPEPQRQVRPALLSHHPSAQQSNWRYDY